MGKIMKAILDSADGKSPKIKNKYAQNLGHVSTNNRMHLPIGLPKAAFSITKLVGWLGEVSNAYYAE